MPEGTEIGKGEVGGAEEAEGGGGWGGGQRMPNATLSPQKKKKGFCILRRAII